MATLTKYLVSDILQTMADLRGDSTVNSDAKYIRAVTRAEQDVALRRFWRVFLLPEQTTTGNGSSTSFTVGSATYPMRPKGLTEVFVGGTTEAHRYAIVDYQIFKNEYNKSAGSHLVYEWYDVATDLWKMRISPTVSNNDTITYSYFWQPPTRTATTDAVVCPNPKILAHLALGDIYLGEGESDLASQHLQLGEQMLDELSGLEDVPAVNQLYAVGSIENAIAPRGIGSY